MIVVNTRSPTPPFEQVRVQIAEQIRSGALPAGDRLPTVRRLAQDLGLAINTIARTYRELESEGLVEARGRNGTIVAWSADEARRELEQAASNFAHRADVLGLSPTEARTLIDHALGLS